MKAISMWQPWASAMFVPRVSYPMAMLKQFETRDWMPSYKTLAPGEKLAIHAAKTQRVPKTKQSLEEWWHIYVFGCGFQNDFAFAGWPGWAHLPFGAIIGYGTYVGAFHTEQLLKNAAVDGVEQHFGNFGPGRYGWQMQSTKRLPVPIPCRGRQSLFDVTIPLL